MSRKKPRRVDESATLPIRDIDKEIPKPIGIYAEDIYDSIFLNNTFVGIPTPIYIKHGRGNIFINNKAYGSRKHSK